MRVARHDFPLSDDYIDGAHVSIGYWLMGNRKEYYRKSLHRKKAD